MQTVSNCLKTPFLCLTEQLLGEMLPESTDCIATIYTYALAMIFGVCLIASLPLWFMGDILEFLSCQDFGDRDVQVINTADLSLDPRKTRFMGFPISTYQSISDQNPNFCPNSDWGKHSQGPKKGVDILTREGLELICQATKIAYGNTVRFSVEWADIYRPDGSFDEAAMQRYVEVAAFIRQQGLMPMVVLHHYVTPLDKNGKNILETPNGINEFVRYATYVHSKLKNHVKQFFTFNELRVNSVENYVMGDYPAQGVAQFWNSERLARTMQEAHKRVHQALHAINRNVVVGMTHQVINFVPSSRWNYLVRMIGFVMTYVFHESFMRWAVKNRTTLDLLGVQYYTRPYLSGCIPDSTAPEGQHMVDEMHYRFDPKGILPTLREMHNRLHVPLIVSETGTAAEKDVDQRTNADIRFATYMDLSLRAVRTAQDEGINVYGYMPWALFDNLEWHHGYTKHFGLIAANDTASKTRFTDGFQTISTVFQRTVAARQKIQSSAQS